MVQLFLNAHFRAQFPLCHFSYHLLKRLFGTLVRKLLLSMGLTLSSNNNSAPQALILVLRDLNNEKSIADPFCTGVVHGCRLRHGKGIQRIAFWR
ncbi:hypothetical protein EMIT0P253_150041 [Pseudomonas sp. IT-P253]